MATSRLPGPCRLQVDEILLGNMKGANRCIRVVSGSSPSDPSHGQGLLVKGSNLRRFVQTVGEGAPTTFIHANHINAFETAAAQNACFILVRETGAASIRWIGREGYAGKLADMKAKTADRTDVAGLVCSPYLRPEAFSQRRLEGTNGAFHLWHQCKHLVTEPHNRSGFDDTRFPQGCRTPYILQNRRGHKHFGCVAFVGHGVPLVPRYVHGDYDLYAILPAGESVDPATWHRSRVREGSLGGSEGLSHLPLEERLFLTDRRNEKRGGRVVRNWETPLSLRVATAINVAIASKQNVVQSLMVNHGEQINLKDRTAWDYQNVLCVLPQSVYGVRLVVVQGKNQHEALYEAIADC